MQLLAHGGHNGWKRIYFGGCEQYGNWAYSKAVGPCREMIRINCSERYVKDKHFISSAPLFTSIERYFVSFNWFSWWHIDSGELFMAFFYGNCYWKTLERFSLFRLYHDIQRFNFILFSSEFQDESLSKLHANRMHVYCAVKCFQRKTFTFISQTSSVHEKNILNWKQKFRQKLYNKDYLEEHKTNELSVHGQHSNFPFENWKLF